ncbi:hypothetical protein WN943_026916 [Citrus x changshan-huyou]
MGSQDCCAKIGREAQRTPQTRVTSKPFVQSLVTASGQPEEPVKKRTFPFMVSHLKVILYPKTSCKSFPPQPPPDPPPCSGLH